MAETKERVIVPRETILSGTYENLSRTLEAIRGAPLPDIPGSLDEISKSLSLREGFYLRTPEKAFAALKRWYEEGDDKSFANFLGDHTTFWLYFFGSAYNYYKRSSKPPILDEINQKYRETFEKNYLDAMEKVRMKEEIEKTIAGIRDDTEHKRRLEIINLENQGKIAAAAARRPTEVNIQQHPQQNVTQQPYKPESMDERIARKNVYVEVKMPEGFPRRVDGQVCYTSKIVNLLGNVLNDNRQMQRQLQTAEYHIGLEKTRTLEEALITLQENPKKTDYNGWWQRRATQANAQGAEFFARLIGGVKHG